MENNKKKRMKPPAQLDSRMLAGGVDYLDYLRLQKRCIQGEEDWVQVCESLGDYNYNHAKKELEKGHTLTAKYFFMAASAVYRVGQYGLNELNEEKLRIYHKVDESVACYTKLYDPPMEKVTIPYKDYNMEGWLLLPKHIKDTCPVVLMIPGATGFKEEFILQAQNMVDRGLAVLLMDGPGQGTTLYFNKGYLEVNIENAYSKMIDFLEKDNRFSDVGVIGGSTGGYYVPRVAAVDKRVKACVLNSGSYYPQEICDFAPIYNHKFALLCGVSDEEMNELWPKMTLEGIAEKIECPLLVAHSDTDPIFSLKGVQRIYDEAKSKDKEMKIYKGTWHCAGGMESEAFRYMADWLADHLK